MPLLAPAGHDQTANANASASAAACSRRRTGTREPPRRARPPAPHRAAGLSLRDRAQAGGLNGLVYLFLCNFISICLFAYVFIPYFFFFLSPPLWLVCPWITMGLWVPPWGFAALASRPGPTEEQGKLPALLPPVFPCLSFPICWGAAISPSREQGYFRLCFEVNEEQLRGYY